jgi:Cof subfamily protein (haloacid dehalogenase superfamily)
MEKIVAIDIDGTLLDSNHKVTDEVFEAIKNAKQNGVHIALCSGRPVFGLKPIIDMLPEKSIEYVITHNGALVLELETGKVISSQTLNADDFELFNHISEQQDTHLCFHDYDGIYTYCRKINDGMARNIIAQQCIMEVLDSIPVEKANGILKLQFIENTPEVVDHLIEVIPTALFEEYHIVRSVRDSLEVMKKGVNKWTGISDLAKYLNVSEEDTIGIGDEENDREMLENVGLSIVMGNAGTEMKKIADIITKSNDESGVAYALENYVYSKVL